MTPPHAPSTGKPTPAASSTRARWGLVALFALLLGGFALGLWGTIIRPPAYEVRGTVVARPASNLLLVNHEPVAGLGMGAMQLMAIFADAKLLDTAALSPGDRVRAAVRQKGDEIVLLRVEKLP